MKRLLAITAITAGLGTGFATPASAACEGKVDVACNQGACTPDYPCTPMICAVYVAPRCVV
jgi:hypothetical protein